MTATSCNRPATGSSRCSAHRRRTRTILSVGSMPRCKCKELRKLGECRAAAGHPRVEARIGVNAGEVVVRTVETGGRVEYTPIGHTANLASRLQTIAPAGSIAVSEHTRRLVEGYFELRALGPTAIRGISEAIDVYEVIGLGSLRTHFEL